ncbi:MAG: hypothetical protein NVS4B8_24530 [Herpetosiphon sp.]
MERRRPASIIVVAYNSQRYLKACLGAIQSDMRATDQLIVVDNGSSDGSGELIRSQFPSVHLISGTNVGYAAGNNRGAADAVGHDLIFLNPDTIIEPGCIDALLQPL